MQIATHPKFPGKLFSIEIYDGYQIYRECDELGKYSYYKPWYSCDDKVKIEDFTIRSI